MSEWVGWCVGRPVLLWGLGVEGDDTILGCLVLVMGEREGELS